MRGEDTNTSTQPQLLPWEWGRRGRLAAGAAPAGSRQQAGTGPPLHGQGPALPAWIHPHSPVMSTASPRLGTSCHPASTQPRAPLPAAGPPGRSTLQGSAAAVSHPFTPWHTKQLRPLPGAFRASRTIPGKAQRAAETRRTGRNEPPELPAQHPGGSRARAASSAAPVLVPGAQHSWKASWAQSSGQLLPWERADSSGSPPACQAQSIPLAQEPSWGTASTMPWTPEQSDGNAARLASARKRLPCLPESSRSWPSTAPSSVCAGQRSMP